MGPKTIHKNLNYYYMVLKRCPQKIVCPHCKVSMLPKLFEKHYLFQHNINGKIHCVWCRRLSWVSGEKKNHVNHLVYCFKDFLKLTPLKEIDNIKSYRLLSMEHKHIEKDFYGHVLANPDLAASQFDCICPLDVDPLPTVHFPDKNLNLAASYLQKYLETRNTHDWMHIMVKAVAFETFVRAMGEDGGNSQMLEFSCWCDGGHYERAEHRQHRHMIVVSHPKNHFQLNVWPKITPENKPVPNFPCKGLKHIKNALYLVNTMGYLSKRRSRCIFSFKERKKNPYRNHHFYLYKTLPKTFRLHLVQFWDGGIYELLCEEKFKNVSMARLAQGNLTKINGRWNQKIKYFYGHESGLVLNVSKGFVPVAEITPAYFYLVGGEKLYLKFSQENETLDNETWIRKQVMGGNCFYDIIEENVWTPRKKVQEVLNFHMPVLTRKNELEIENANLKEKLASKDLKISKLNDEIKSYILKINELNNILNDLKLKLNKSNIKKEININGNKIGNIYN